MATELDTRTGGCLCGAVTVSAMLPGTGMQLCHCKQCQTWTGGGPLTAIRAKDVVFEGEENIQSYCASGHGERGFCRICGSTIFWKMQGKPPAFLPIGLFEDQSGIRVTEEIFVDRRPDWLPAHEGAAQHDEAEMQAQLAAYLARSGDG